MTSIVKKLQVANKHFLENVGPIMAETLEMVTVIILHLAPLPAFIGLMTGLSDRPPQPDILLFVYLALLVQFLRATIKRDLLIMSCVGIGFIMQAILLSIILFK